MFSKQGNPPSGQVEKLNTTKESKKSNKTTEEKLKKLKEASWECLPQGAQTMVPMVFSYHEPSMPHEK